MRPGHPGVYECKGKGSKKLHWWVIRKDGTSYCQFCKIGLNEEETKELDLGNY